MKEAIQAMAESCERATRHGLTFHVNAFIYYGHKGYFEQVLRHDYQGGEGDWPEVIREAMSDVLAEDQSDALMLRWVIDFACKAGNHRIGDRSEHDT
jgi:hypothetical protein